MTGFVTKATISLVASATALTVAAPADAQRYREHRDRDNTGAVVAAGIAGIVIGAAISNRDDRRYANDRRYDYDRRFYRERGYYPTDGRYARRYARSYRDCTVRRVWDRYERRTVRVRYCR